MNYFKIVNQFWKWQRHHKISHTEAFLYFAILDYANTLHWKTPFNIPNTSLMEICRLSKMQLIRYRNRLQSAGLIRYQSGTRGKAGEYEICLLFPDSQNSSDTNSVTNPVTKTVTNPDTNSVTIHKIKNKNKIKIKKEYAPFVHMTESEYQLLIREYGEPSAQRMIEELNWYKESSGKEYFSDYAAIKGWVHKRVQAQKPKSAPDTTLMVYQDDYDHEQLERIARQNAMKQREQSSFAATAL